MKKGKVNSILVAAVSVAFIASVNTACNAQTPPQGERREPPKFSELLEKMDTDEDGKLSESEVKGPLKENFAKVDIDEDGFITQEEFKKAPKPKREGSPRR
jgi:Ca2+-binding EF-hand superfamily protein